MSIPAIEAAALRDVMRRVSAEMPGAPTQPLRVGEVVAGKVVLMPDGQRGISISGVPIKATVPGDVPLGEPLKLQVTESSGNRLVLHIVRSDESLAATFPPGVRGAAAPAGAANAGGAQDPKAAAAASAADARPGTVAADAKVGGAAAAGTQGAQGAPALQLPATVDPAMILQTPWAAIPMPGGAQARMWLDPDGQGDADGDGGGGRDRARTMVVRYESPTMGRVDVVLRLETEKLETSVLAQAGHPIAQVRAAVPALREALTAATGRNVALTTGGRAIDPVSVNA